MGRRQLQPGPGYTTRRDATVRWTGERARTDLMVQLSRTKFPAAANSALLNAGLAQRPFSACCSPRWVQKAARSRRITNTIPPQSSAYALGHIREAPRRLRTLPQTQHTEKNANHGILFLQCVRAWRHSLLSMPLTTPKAPRIGWSIRERRSTAGQRRQSLANDSVLSISFFTTSTERTAYARLARSVLCHVIRKPGPSIGWVRAIRLPQTAILFPRRVLHPDCQGQLHDPGCKAAARRRGRMARAHR